MPRTVINAKGPATVLGGAKVAESVSSAMASALRKSVHMAELQFSVGAEIARLLHAESAFVTGCAAAGISVSVAAAITGDDLHQITTLPLRVHDKCEVVIQKAHNIIVGGCDAAQVIRLAGGDPVEVGTAADCAEFQLQGGLSARTAAALFIEGERAHGSGTLGLRRFAEICHESDVPVIVDAAGTADPRPLLAAGADLVVFSGQKWFRGPTSGVVAGRADLIHAAFLTGELGIGRPMKAGKEAVAGIGVAVQEMYSGTGPQDVGLSEATLGAIAAKLSKLPGLAATVEPTRHESTSPFCVRIDVDPALAGIQAWQLSAEAEGLDPSVALYDYEAALGYLLIDPGFLDETEVEPLLHGIRTVVESSRRQPRDLSAECPPRYTTLASHLTSWRS